MTEPTPHKPAPIAGTFVAGAWATCLTPIGLLMLFLSRGDLSGVLPAIGSILLLVGATGSLLMYIGVCTLIYRWLKAGDHPAA